MSPPRKTLAQYEAEATATPEGCLLHPSAGAARKVYVLRHGALPSNIAVCHRCDTPTCIADAHHFPGTWADNVRDAVAKGRHSCFKNGAKKGEMRPGFGKLRDPAANAKISEGLRRAWAEGRRGKRRNASA